MIQYVIARNVVTKQSLELVVMNEDGEIAASAVGGLAKT